MIVESSDFNEVSFTMTEDNARIIAGLLYQRACSPGIDEKTRHIYVLSVNSIQNAARGIFSKKREICICPHCGGAKEIYIENKAGERETTCCPQCLGEGMIYVATHVHTQPLTDELRESLIK